MKKMEKYFPLIVGLVILLSVAAYGTRAYFSDSASEQSNINLTLGTVNVDGMSGEWKYDIAQTNIVEHNNQLKNDNNLVNGNTLGKSPAITDARPGDSFSKEITFTNEGTLDQNVTFSTSNENKKNLFKVTWLDKYDRPLTEDSSLLKAGDSDNSVTVTMKVTVSTDLDHKYDEADSANDPELSENLNKFVNETVKVIAEQTNAPATASAN